MKIKAKLKQLIKKMEGNVLSIGLRDEELLEQIYDNEKIIVFNTFNNTENDENPKVRIFKFHKTYSIKKIRKLFKRKKVDYILCNYHDIEKYLRHFIKDSVFINKKDLYIYGNFEYNEILKKYQRYKINFTIFELKDGIVLKIDNTNSKNNKFKDLMYYSIDTAEYIANVIGDILTY